MKWALYLLGGLVIVGLQLYRQKQEREYEQPDLVSRMRKVWQADVDREVS